MKYSLMGLLYSEAAQGTDDWLAARRGVITASRFKDARDRSDGLTKQQRTYADALRQGSSPEAAQLLADYKKPPTGDWVEKAVKGTLPMVYSATALGYAMDVARERCGGLAMSKFQSFAMKKGQTEEPDGRREYEAYSGNLVEQVGFYYTEDRKFGVSVDGLIEHDGVNEIKTMVSSATLFRAVIDGDVSEFQDQCDGAMWLLHREWVDLVLWVPDLPELTRVIRIERNEERIEALVKDLVDFERLVTSYESKLRKAMSAKTTPVLEPA